MNFAQVWSWLLWALVLSCGFPRLFGGQQAPANQPASEASSHETHIQMHRVNLHIDDQAVLNVKELNGKLVPLKPGEPPGIGEKYTFAIAIESADIVVTAQNLTLLLNRYAFADAKSPVRNVQISIDGRQMKQKGVLHKGLDVPFEMLGTVSVTPEGKIRLHPSKFKVGHLPVKGLLDFFGVETDDLVNGKHMHGATVDHEDLILDPAKLVPAPEIRGKLTSVNILSDGLEEIYGSPGARAPAARGNYITYRGGTIRFGKLIMINADLKLIDTNPRDAFDFNLDHYLEQLVAGYTKTTPAWGLEVFMPDYYQLQKAKAQPRPAASGTKAQPTAEAGAKH